MYILTHVSVGSIQAGEFNVVLSGVGPVDSIINKVQSESIGPGYLILDDCASVSAVHPNAPNMRIIPPI